MNWEEWLKWCALPRPTSKTDPVSDKPSRDNFKDFVLTVRSRISECQREAETFEHLQSDEEYKLEWFPKLTSDRMVEAVRLAERLRSLLEEMQEERRGE